jgi:dienelactone hydrolase
MKRALSPAFVLATAASLAPEVQAASEVRTATGHAMQYAVSRPTGWTAGKRWPVLVVIPDAGRDFLGNLDAFVRARGDRPLLLVAPYVVTSGGTGYRAADSYHYSESDWAEVKRAGDFGFDDEGIAAVLADVRKRDGGEDRYFLTGWEAGGHTVWATLFRHPERLRGVVPVSTNYKGRWLDAGAFSAAPDRADLPVRVLFVGAAAAESRLAYEAWLGQTKEAMEVARTHGFRNVSLSFVEKKPHGPLAEEVLDAVGSLMGR